MISCAGRRCEKIGIVGAKEIKQLFRSLTADLAFENGYVLEGGSIQESAHNFLSDFIEIEEGVTYHYSAYNSDNQRIERVWGYAYYDQNKNFQGRRLYIPYDELITLTGANKKYIRIWQDIEKGTSPVTLMRFDDIKTISLPLGDIELRSTPDGTRDTFVRVDGVWNKVSNVGNVILDGSVDDWLRGNESQDTDTHMFFALLNIINLTDIIPNVGLCDKFTYAPTWTKESRECFSMEDAYYPLRIRIAKSRLTSLDVAGFKAYLSSNTVKLHYALATPTYTPITDETLIQALDTIEQLILHKGYNRITVTSVNGVKAYLDLSIPSTASVTEVVETESSLDMPESLK